MNSEKIISLHQSNFLPYIGFWAKIYHSDIFINDIEMDYSRSNSFQSRTYYYKQNGVLDYLSLEVEKNKKLKDTKIINYKSNCNKILNIFAYYKNNNADKKKVNYFFNEFKKILDKKEYKFLIDLNQEFFNFVYDYLDLKTEVKILEDIDLTNSNNKTDRLLKRLDIFDIHNEYAYLSGKGGIDYMDLGLFADRRKVFLLERKNDVFMGNIVDYFIKYDKNDIIKKFNDDFIIKKIGD